MSEPIPPAHLNQLLSTLLTLPSKGWSSEDWSNAMGVASIGCWTVAQAPQIWENYQSQSCEGLALPFLVNWLAGDLTNLVGCILTDQKEFQTLLAAYFCLIDIGLTGQYLYYRRKTTLHIRKENALLDSAISSAVTGHLADTRERERGRGRSMSHKSDRGGSGFSNGSGIGAGVGKKSPYGYGTDGSGSRSGTSSSELKGSVGRQGGGALSPLVLPGRHSSFISPELPTNQLHHQHQHRSGGAGTGGGESLQVSPAASTSYGMSASLILPGTKADGLPSGTRRYSNLPHSQPNSSMPRDDLSLSALQEAALEVARAAEKIERSRSRKREEKVHRERARERAREALTHSGVGKGKGRLPGTREEGDGDGDDADVEVEGDDLKGSFLSDSSSRSGGNEHIKWAGAGVGTSAESSPRATIRKLNRTSSGVTFEDEDPAERGRERQKRFASASSPGEGEEMEEEGDGNGSGFTVRPKEKSHSSSRNRSLIRGPKGKAAGVVFMGVWVLFGLGSRPGLGGKRGLGRDVGKSGGEVGRVMQNGGGLDVFSAYINPSSPGSPDEIARSQQYISLPSSDITLPEASDRHSTDNDHHDRDNDNHRREDKQHRDNEMIKRTIGRISAWICTTLYLTSRLPQIWKNYQRKSVEGLSILLFFFAFNGNLTYVLSILLNPAGSEGNDPETRMYYLLEALPYLLGSGGTLIFDLTIMFQSFYYGAAPPLPETTLSHSLTRDQRSRSTVRRTPRLTGKALDEESQPLLTSRGRSTTGRQRLLSDGQSEGH